MSQTRGLGDAGWVWLTGWLLCAAVVTMYPFDFGVVTKNPVLGFLAGNLRLSGWIDVALNVLLFVPIGVLVAHLGRGARRRMVVLGAAGIGLLLSGLIEYLQAYLPLRNPSLTDILSNTGGAIGGAAAHEQLRKGLVWLRQLVSPVLVIGLLVVFTALALSVSAGLQLRTRLNNWDSNYPLLIGNEATGDRPWRGRVFSFELTDAATPANAVRDIAAGTAPPSQVISGTPIAAVDFTDGVPYDDNGHLPRFEWVQPGIEPTGGGHVSGRNWLRTDGPVSELALRLGEANAFTLHLRCATDDLRQGGPARILSNSADPYHRNFTLGQEHRDMVFRLRTRHTGLDGDIPEAVVRDVFTDTQPRDILVTYDGATLLVATAGSGHVYRMTLNPGSSLKTLYTRIRADELQIHGAAYIAALFLLPGVLAGVLAVRRRVVLWAGFTFAFALLLELTAVLVSGRWFDWGAVAFTGFVGAAILTLSAGSLSTVAGE